MEHPEVQEFVDWMRRYGFAADHPDVHRQLEHLRELHRDLDSARPPQGSEDPSIHATRLLGLRLLVAEVRQRALALGTLHAAQPRTGSG